MLYWSDWQLELELKDSPHFRQLVLLALSCVLCALLVLAYFEAIFFGIIILLSLHAFYCWRCYWSSQASHGLASLFCNKGSWSAMLNNGECIHDLHLKRYFIGRLFLLLVFQEEQKKAESSILTGWPYWLPHVSQHRFIISPEQLGEESFRQLLVLLRYRASCLEPGC